MKTYRRGDEQRADGGGRRCMCGVERAGLMLLPVRTRSRCRARWILLSESPSSSYIPMSFSCIV